MTVTIEHLTIEHAPQILEWVQQLLIELGEEHEDLGELDSAHICRTWEANRDHIHTLIARSDDTTILGIATVVESFAIYANGHYGIINEMYVIPDHRSLGIGHLLIDAVKALGQQHNWTRIDVTAPESQRWNRTRQFYEREGFVFTGPKLKYRLA